MVKKITREKYNIQRLEDPKILKRFVEKPQKKYTN